MESRIRKDVSHFFECFCEVVPKSAGSKEPWVIQKFPDTYRDEEVLKSVTNFAYPCDFENTSIQHYSFVLTNIQSKWTFGYCRHDPKTETALVVLSFLPWHSAFYKFLNNIAVLTQSPKSEELTDFLTAAYNTPVPKPGFTFTVHFNHGQSTFTCQSPRQFQLPSIPDNRNLTEYYNAVDAHNMMGVYAAMLHERRVVFTSRKPHRLSACVQAANELVYPMSWQHIFIPVLPMALKDYLLAPMPYLIGVPETVFKQVRKSDIGEVVVMDADQNKLETPFNDLENLPQEVVSQLKRALRNQDLLGDAVSRAFLRSLAHLIGGYGDALVNSPDSTKRAVQFDEELFVESRPSYMQPFLRHMLQLQIFQQFIEERIHMRNEGIELSDEFELEACKYTEKFNNKLKQQTKEFFKTVKDKANPAVKSAVKSVKEGGKGVKSAYKELKSKFREPPGPEELERGFRTYSKPRSAPSSPTSSKRILNSLPALPMAKVTYRKQPSQHLKPATENRNMAYSPLSPPSNPTSPDSPDQELFSPLNMDLLGEMQDVLYRRHIDIPHDGNLTPPVDRSLKPVRSLESFKQTSHTTSNNNSTTHAWWEPSIDAPSPTRSRLSIPHTISPHPNAMYKSNSQILMHSLPPTTTASLLDATDDVFFSPPVPPRRASDSNRDLFGAAPFVVGGVKGENGEPMFLVASTNSVDMVKLSPPVITFSSRSKNNNTSADLITLDSTSSDSIDDFDPLLSRNKQSSKVTHSEVRSNSCIPQMEFGLANPLYFNPPVLNQQTHRAESSGTDLDLLQEYGIDFNKFKLQNGQSVVTNNKITSTAVSDPFEQVARPEIIHSQQQWTKFD